MEVEQDDIGRQLTREHNGFGAIACLGDDREGLVLCEEQSQSAADDVLIVDKQDGGHEVGDAARAGMRARTRQPREVDPASKDPPNSSTRSRIPRRPRPVPWRLST